MSGKEAGTQREEPKHKQESVRTEAQAEIGAGAAALSARAWAESV
jgi:hypothetical protein